MLNSKLAIALLLPTLLCACSTSKTLTGLELASRTDFIPGQILRLKKDVYLHSTSLRKETVVPTLHLLGSHGSPTTSETFEREMARNPSYIGLLKAGQKQRDPEILAIVD